MWLAPRLKIPTRRKQSHGRPSLVVQWSDLCSLNAGAWPPRHNWRSSRHTEGEDSECRHWDQCSQINILKNPTEDGLTSPPKWLQLRFNRASLSKIRFRIADMSVIIISSKGVMPTFKNIFYKVYPGLKLQSFNDWKKKGDFGKTLHD